MPRVIAVTSGKGGVGKSNFVLNVGICLAMMDNRVQILDADLGLANLDVLLGIRTDRTIEDVVVRGTDPRNVVVKTDYRVELIPGSSGTQDMADLKKEHLEDLAKKTLAISADADFLLVDTASGISAGVISFLLASPEVIVGVSPEPTSLTDAYALIKVLKKNDFQGRISMFSSMVKNSASGHALYKKICSASRRFLDTHVEFLGSVYRDEKLPKAVSDQVPAVVRYPTSDISRCYRVIASTILGQGFLEADQHKFWARLITLLTKMTRPASMKAVSFNGSGEKNGDLESTIHDILHEQRKTRELLERLVQKIERNAYPGAKTGPSA